MAIDALIIGYIVAGMLFGRLMFPAIGSAFGLSAIWAWRLFFRRPASKTQADRISIGALLIGAVLGATIMNDAWAWTSTGMRALWMWTRQAAIPFQLWTMIALLLLWCTFAIRKQAAIGSVLTTGAAIALSWAYYSPIPPLSALGYSGTWDASLWYTAWSRLRLLLGIAIIPPGIFWAVLAMRMLAEVLFGTTIPLQLMPAEISQVSPWDLLFPGISTRVEAAAQVDPETIRIWIHTPNQDGEHDQEDLVLPLPDGGRPQLARWIAAALRYQATNKARGVGITERGAKQYGYTTTQWRGKADPKTGHKAAGVKARLESRGLIVDMGNQGAEFTGKGIAWACGLIDKTLGPEAIPGAYRTHSPAPEEAEHDA
jgi:hypothetical protein